MNDLRRLPSVEVLLQGATEWIGLYGRGLTLDAIRQTLSQIRARKVSDEQYPLPDQESILAEAGSLLAGWMQPSLVPVINASGVILHTNLGRAPLSQAAVKALTEAALGYSTLEYDLEKGTRGSRSEHAESLLTRLTGAEAALVVNNNAAALLLVLTALARRRRVVISRSQLVEIGGGFRVPEVMNQSGARLVEVGTTNRVNPRDYETALEEPCALVLRAHHSNYKITGFTEEVEIGEIVRLAHAKSVPVLDDLGSGALVDTAQFGMAHEPTIQESLRAGADLVCVSGDKLLGGPQAGIILGRKDLIDRIRKHPLARAVRADKLCLAALSATLAHYLREEWATQIPVWRMISMEGSDILRRANCWRETLQTGEILPGFSTVGGGSLPGELLATHLLGLHVKQADRFLARLRKASPPVIARVENDLVLLDPRTVLPDQDGDLLDGLRQVLSTIV